MLTGKWHYLVFVLQFSIIAMPLADAQEFSTSSGRAIKLYREGKQKFNLLEYREAESLLGKAIEIDGAFIEGYMLLGDIYRTQKKFADAIVIYNKVIDIQPDKYPQAWYFSGLSYYAQQNYNMASRRLKKFLTYENIGLVSKEDAIFIMACCEFAINAIKNPVPFKPENLGAGINSENQEYVNSVRSDELLMYFTRRTLNVEAGTDLGEDFYASFRRVDHEPWGIAEKMGEPVNSSFDEGALTISPDARYLLFAACYRPDGYGSCDIYAAKMKGENTGQPVNLGPVVNTSYWETQPSLASDGRTLYFVSTREGGFGKSDIWVTSLQDDGSWAVPENLGSAINTKGSELSPFIHPDGQTLYFSSDGQIGMGGIDLFLSRKDTLGNWSPPENLGYPVNTAADEMNIIVNAQGNKAYLSSNQLGGFGGFDIFEFDLPDKSRPRPSTYMKGVVRDKITLKPLEAYFELTDLGKTTKVIHSFSDESTGEFLVCIPTNHEYVLNVSRNGYLFYSDNITLTGITDQFTPIIIDIALDPVQEGTTLVLRNIFFDTGEYTLKDESKIELANVLEFLKANPGLVVEIGGHTDNIGGVEFNQALSDNRARAVTGYLISQGISPERLKPEGYGFSKPIGDNDSEQGRAKNRRTEIKILEVRQ